MNYKNLNYEIETGVICAAVPTPARRVAMNYKNLNYEIETLGLKQPFSREKLLSYEL